MLTRSDWRRLSVLLWRPWTVPFILSFALMLSAAATPVPAKHKEGSKHGFLVLKSSEGKLIAVGDQLTVATGHLVRSRLILRFLDGSIDDEITVFRQDTVLQILSDHHVQKGPSFPNLLDESVDVKTGMVTWHEQKDGTTQVKTQHVDLPADLANGIITLVLENYPKSAAQMNVSNLTGNPKPRVVQLLIKHAGSDGFQIGPTTQHAEKFDIHIELGGVAGLLAPLAGKKPTDINVWVMGGEVPAFLKMEGALYLTGPIWTAELASLVWR